MGEVCPLCGRTGCRREIPPYWRRAIELFPYREGKIPISRFQCREQMRTFSLLPYQLAPYRLYTIESMILSVIVWCEYHREGEGEAKEAVKSLHDDSRVTPWLLRNWLAVVIVSSHSAFVRPQRSARFAGSRGIHSSRHCPPMARWPGATRV